MSGEYFFPAVQKNLARNIIATLINHYKIKADELEESIAEILEMPRRIICLSQRNHQIHFSPYLEGKEPGKIRFEILSEQCWSANQDPYYMSPIRKHCRLLDWFENLHPAMDQRPGLLGFYTLSVNVFREDQWFLHFSDTCRKAGMAVEGWKNLKDNYELHRPER